MSGRGQERVGDLPVVSEPRDLVLPSEPAPLAHPGVERAPGNEGDEGRTHPDVAGSFRVVVVVPAAERHVGRARERLGRETVLGGLQDPLEAGRPSAAVPGRAETVNSPGTMPVAAQAATNASSTSSTMRFSPQQLEKAIVRPATKVLSRRYEKRARKVCDAREAGQERKLGGRPARRPP